MAGDYHVPLTIEVRLEGEHEGDPRITTLHYRYAATGFRPNAAQLLAVANMFLTFVYPHLAACVTGLTRWHNIVVTDINDSAGARAELPLVGPYVGSRAGSPTAGNVQLALVKHVASRQRGANGRLFVMDLSNDDVVDSFISAALDVLLQTLINYLLRSLSDGTNNYLPVVASRKHHSFSPIYSISYDSITDELITRLRNHRKHKRHHVPA